jgi:hypothetical protein
MSRKISVLTPLIVLAMLSPSTTPSLASLGKTRCQPTPQGQLCISEVDFGSFAQNAYVSQFQSQWCWAACVSMLFRYYKHPVDQRRIVAALYGTTVNLAAGTGWNLANQLNRDWMDDNGKKFSSRVTAAYDFDAGVYGANNNWIISELDRDHPIVIGAGTHAVVGTAIQYYTTPLGPNVVSIGVFDPWPGVGARGLGPQEMVAMNLGGTLRFVATVSVSD